MPSALRTTNNKQLTINNLKNSQLSKVKGQLFKSGITLIELLITIAIVTILATATIYSYSSSQQRARDGQRKRDLDQIKKALELAKQDCTGGSYYPIVANTPGNNDYDRYVNLQGHLANANLKYMGSVPQDPKNTSTYKYTYSVITSGTGFTADVCPDTASGRTQDGSTEFVLSAKMENSTDSDAAASVSKCNGKAGITTASGNYYVCSD